MFFELATNLLVNPFQKLLLWCTGWESPVNRVLSVDTIKVTGYVVVTL
jgi:hypothetical protein